jgi:phage-related minor tail protein
MSIGTTIANMMALLSLDNADFMSGVNETLESTDSFMGKLGSVGAGIVVGGLSAAGAAIGAIGAASWEAGNTIDAALDMIETNTGATGATMTQLKADFEDVFTDFPTDADKAAGVVATLNSRLDTTGPNLTNLAGPLLEVSRLLGGDATTNAELFTRVMGDWSLPLDDASVYLDALYVAAQQTGAPIEGLMQKVVQFGAPLRQMGFSFEESAAMLAKWEQEGVNADLVLGSLRIAAGHFADQGVDLSQGLWDTVDAIQNASSESEGLRIAMDVFGARAGPDMAAAIREGRFELGDLVEQMQNADGAILETADSTADWGESWQKFLNKVTVRLAPLGAQMMDTAGEIVDSLGAIFDRPEVQAGITQFAGFASQLITTFASAIPVVIDYLFQFVSFLQNNQGVVVAILAAIGVAVAAFVYTTVIPAALAAIGAMLPIILVMAAVAAVAYLIYEAWTNNWGGIRDYLMGVWQNLQPTFEALKQWLGVAIPAAIDYLRFVWNYWLTSAKLIWAFLQQYIFPILGAVANVISAVLSVAFRALAGIMQNVVIPKLKEIWRWIDANVMPIVRTLAAWLNEHLGPAFEWLGGKVGEVVDWLHNLADTLRNIQLPDWMTPGSPTPWELGLRGVQDTLESLSRTTLPRFEAAVALQPVPVGAGSVDIQPRGVPVDAGAGTGRGSNGASEDDPLMRELTRLLRNLPDTLKKAIRDDSLRRNG